MHSSRLVGNPKISLILSLGISTGKAACRWEGKLIAPWANELRTCENGKTGLDGRGLVIDVKNLTGISQCGEDVLLALMNEGAKFHCRGVFAKQILRQLASRRRRNVKETTR